MPRPAWTQCTISIYTISGELVRTLQHSDLTGPLAQQTWDGNTSHGEHAASGVYLWRVESPVDSKNGKLDGHPVNRMSRILFKGGVSV